MMQEWWKEFQDEELNCLMLEALGNNLDLYQAWDRLAQARAQACIDSADKWPQVFLNANVTQTKSHGNVAAAGINPGQQGASFGNFTNGTFTRYLLTEQLTYEIDLWRKIDSRSRASCAEMWATVEEVDATALLLSGAVAEQWFTIQAQRALIKVIEEQIRTNQTQLELIELRYTVGTSSALEVYQQRLQLANTEAELPPAYQQLETAINQLAVLLGRVPDECIDRTPQPLAISLPPLPCIGSPWYLVNYRPDLRADRQRLVAADYKVAEAIADRFPRLQFNMSYALSAAAFKDIFDREVFSIAGDLLQPLIDGGRRRCEVEKRWAIVCERLNAFGQTFLTAIKEVEDALVLEKYQIQLIEELERELQIATTNLTESQIHYLNGLNDYLTVIVAIQAKQNLERRIVEEKKQLLIIRSQLYLALGGAFTVAQ